MAKKDEQVFAISTAAPSLADQQKIRHRKYLISMTLRIICFSAALFTEGGWRWFFFVGAAVFPWVAVVVANAGVESGIRRRSSAVVLENGRELL